VKGIGWTLLLVSAASLLAALNPWFPAWQRSGLVVLLVEAAALVLVVLPSTLYLWLVRRKSWRESLDGSLRTLVDFLGGWA
jgi:hypothetical protein